MESVSLFDVYQGTHIEKGMKSMAFSLRFRDAEKTLTDEDVQNATNVILSDLQGAFGAKLRS